MKEWGLVGQLDSLHHWHMASYSGDSWQWKEQDTAAKALTCISDTLQTIYNDTEYKMSCWALANYPHCGTYLMQFNVAKPFNSMVKCAWQYAINIYIGKYILLIHWMLALMREHNNERIIHEKDLNCVLFFFFLKKKKEKKKNN